jgi:hypothetical protein
VLWPAFLMAGVLEMLVFAVVDPESLQDSTGEALPLSRSAAYSVAFLVFWAAIATSAAITRRLDTPGRAPRFD